MNIFELFVKLTHPVKKSGWVETTAYFTGEYRSPRRTGRGRYPSPVRVSSATKYYEYMIRDYTEDGERTGWYLFYPGPDPSPEDIRGLTFQISHVNLKAEKCFIVTAVRIHERHDKMHRIYVF